MKAQLATNDGICEVLFNCVEKMRELLSLYDQGHAVLQRPGLESVLESAVAQLELQSSKIGRRTSSRKQPAARRASDKEREGGQSDVSSCSLCSDGAMSAEGTFVWKKIRRNEKYYHPKADKRSAENPWITSQFRHKATSKKNWFPWNSNGICRLQLYPQEMTSLEHITALLLTLIILNHVFIVFNLR